MQVQTQEQEQAAGRYGPSLHHRHRRCCRCCRHGPSCWRPQRRCQTGRGARPAGVGSFGRSAFAAEGHGPSCHGRGQCHVAALSLGQLQQQQQCKRKTKPCQDGRRYSACSAYGRGRQVWKCKLAAFMQVYMVYSALTSGFMSTRASVTHCAYLDMKQPRAPAGKEQNCL
jgi:hypothetical protein